MSQPTGFQRLFRDTAFLSALVATLVGIAGFAWWMRPSRPADEAAKPRNMTHMHCPNCREEIPYDLHAVNKKCTACSNPGYFVPTAGSIADADKESGLGGIVLVVLGVVLASQLLVFFGAARMRTLRERDEQVRYRKLLA